MKIGHLDKENLIVAGMTAVFSTFYFFAFLLAATFVFAIVPSPNILAWNPADVVLAFFTFFL